MLPVRIQPVFTSEKVSNLIRASYGEHCLSVLTALSSSLLMWYELHQLLQPWSLGADCWTPPLSKRFSTACSVTCRAFNAASFRIIARCRWKLDYIFQESHKILMQERNYLYPSNSNSALYIARNISIDEAFPFCYLQSNKCYFFFNFLCIA